MSAITLAQAQAQLAAMLAAQSSGNFRSVSIGGRTITYATAQEFQSQITFWARMVSELERKAAGLSRHGHSLADFRRVR
jgi:hypothetical protein